LHQVIYQGDLAFTYLNQPQFGTTEFESQLTRLLPRAQQRAEDPQALARLHGRAQHVNVRGRPADPHVLLAVEGAAKKAQHQRRARAAPFAGRLVHGHVALQLHVIAGVPGVLVGVVEAAELAVLLPRLREAARPADDSPAVLSQQRRSGVGHESCVLADRLADRPVLFRAGESAIGQARDGIALRAEEFAGVAVADAVGLPPQRPGFRAFDPPGVERQLLFRSDDN